MPVCAVALLALPAAWSFDDAGWPILTVAGRALTQPAGGRAIEIGLDDAPLPGDAAPHIDGGSAAWDLPGGVLSEHLAPFDALPHGVARTIRYRRTGPRADLVGAHLRLGAAAAEGARRWSAASFMMLELEPGGPTLCAAFTSDEDHWGAELATGANPRLAHRCQTAWRLAPGDEALVGTQYLWLVPGDLEAARATTAGFYRAVGLTVADDGPDWFRDMVLYQASAGGGVESRFGDVGGFAAFAKQLDYLSDLGCNAVWLQAATTHKVPENPADGWNLYGPLRFDQIDPSYGGEAGLKALMAEFRARGFRVIGEIVPHGGTAPEAVAHPEWWTYNRDGTRQQHFGQSCDYSAPGWCELMRRSIEWQTREFGFDGIRIDVADGSGTNWHSPTNGPHVSLSTAGGGIAMLRAVRDGQLAGGAIQPAITPETENRPEYARWGPIGYGFPFSFFLEDLQPASLPPSELKARLVEYFERERGSMPPGMILLRYLNNHDSVVMWGRADRRFGVGLQRALTGVCCVIDGVPMIYQEQEVGSYDYFRRLFWARRAVPELRRGNVRYVGIETPEAVFAVLRTLGDSQAVGLVNLTWEPARGIVRLPEPLADGTVLHDAVSGGSLIAADGGFTIDLPPYATAILRLGRPPDSGLPPEAHRAESLATALEPTFVAGGVQATVRGGQTAFTAAEGGRRLEVLGGETVEIEFLGVDRWLVETVTGPCDDRLVRRHYPWPAGGWQWPDTIGWGYDPWRMSHGHQLSDRLWQSRVAPLREGGRIVLRGPGGDGLTVRIEGSNAANIVLTDRSIEPDPSPYGLTLRLLAADPATDANWIPDYRSPGWRIEPAPPPPAVEPLRAVIELRAGTGGPPAGPVPPRAASRRTGPGQVSLGQERLWLIEPNWVEWSGLEVPVEGDYVLWVQLRHSERGPSEIELTPHYRLDLDGRPCEWRWDRLNVWSTGNGYFGWARIALGHLPAGPHTLRIETSHSWCAVSTDLICSGQADWEP